ncbi:MAG: hypothetical protein ACOC8L_08780 [Spirochaetota bacterium]
MAGNPFLDYLATHPRADALALKELFRILAKRTHPDLTQAEGQEFIELQEAYHEAVKRVLDTPEVASPPSQGATKRAAERRTPRDNVLALLYRYQACLPHGEISAKPLPPRCMQLFHAAIGAAVAYTHDAQTALENFDRHFHKNRAAVARYPDVRTKYLCLLRGIHSFFDYQIIPSAFNRRVCVSFFDEVRAVSDYDLAGSPEWRNNRSATARAALYQMRVWLEGELERPVARVL